MLPFCRFVSVPFTFAGWGWEAWARDHDCAPSTGVLMQQPGARGCRALYCDRESSTNSWSKTACAVKSGAALPTRGRAESCEQQAQIATVSCSSQGAVACRGMEAE